MREEETAMDPMKAVKCTLQNTMVSNKDDEASVACDPVTGGPVHGCGHQIPGPECLIHLSTPGWDDQTVFTGL